MPNEIKKQLTQHFALEPVTKYFLLVRNSLHEYPFFNLSLFFSLKYMYKHANLCHTHTLPQRNDFSLFTPFSPFLLRQ